MKRVVIVQSTVRHYRVGFFAALHSRLAQDCIDLRVVYSDPNAHEAEKHDHADLNSEVGVKVRADWLLADRLVYQHAWLHVADANLVVVEQASKHLLNYALFASRAVSPRKIALWGHGFSRHGTRLARLLRHYTLRLPDWWFGYTSRTVQYLIAQGVPAEITTNVQNAIDTDGLSRAADRVSSAQIAALRCALGVNPGARVGLYCGSLYSHKNIPMLIASSVLIRASLPNFHLVIVGDGPDRSIATDAASKYSWVHYAGPMFGDDRAPYFRMADIVMNPGLVGLGILDAFAVGLPVLTTDIPIHCPEIEYLEDGRNGTVSCNDPVAYAAAVTGALVNRELLARLREGAYMSGRKYTLGGMVENFAGGIEACLVQVRRKGTNVSFFRGRPAEK
jgi:glycosyltransferase involved in cell wall biosynthesis